MNRATHFTGKATHSIENEERLARKAKALGGRASRGQAHLDKEYLKGQTVQQSNKGRVRICLEAIREYELTKHQRHGSPYDIKN